MITAKAMSAGDGYEYYLRHTATGDVQRAPGADMTAYYTVDGNPPGVWIGGGTHLVGMNGEVSEAQMKALYGEGLHPAADAIMAQMKAAGAAVADIESAIKLGRGYYTYNVKDTSLKVAVQKERAEFERLHGRKPDRNELRQIRMREGAIAFRNVNGRAHRNNDELAKYVSSAMKPAQHAVAGFDLTFSVPKSVSVLMVAGDTDMKKLIDEAQLEAIERTLHVLETEILATRAGVNGVRQIDVNGGAIATRFRHYESRDGDPHVHDHLVIANKVQGADGVWRTVDSKALLRSVVYLSETHSRFLAEGIERRGVPLESKVHAEGKAPMWEVAGMPEQVIDLFSTRRNNIRKHADALTADYVAEHGRFPDADTARKLGEAAWDRERRQKDTPRTLPELAADVHQRAQHAGLDGLLNNALATIQTATRAKELSTTGRAHTDATKPTIDVYDAAAQIMRAVESKRATWNAFHVKAEIQRYLTGNAHRTFTLTDAGTTTPMPAADVEEFLLRTTLQLDSIQVTPPPGHGTFQPLTRAVGSSVYTDTGATLYTSTRFLEAEADLLRAARTLHDGPAPVDPATFARALADMPNRDEAQVRFARECVTNRTQLMLGVGPAGAGKTRSTKLAAHAVHLAGGRVIGLARAAKAAAVLARDVNIPAYTLDLFLTLHRAAAEHGTPVDERFRINPGDLVIIDEAAMTGTLSMREAVKVITDAGGYVLATGDHAQIGATDGGGWFRLIHQEVGGVELETVYRFTNPDEAAASLTLRESAPGVDPFAWYKDNGRIIAGTRDVIAEVMFADYLADITAGHDSIMAAPTRDYVDELNSRAQAHAIATGTITGTASVRLRGGDQARIGDRIMTRKNNTRLRMNQGRDTVKNGDIFTVQHIHPNGDITAVHTLHGGTIRLPADYLQAHSHLGYAYTAHGEQGETIGAPNIEIQGYSRGIANATTERSQAYVPLTRGTDGNYLYVEVEAGQHPNDVLAKIAANVDTNLSAHEMIARESARVTDLSSLIDEYSDITSLANAKRFETLATHTLGNDNAHALTGSAGWEATAAGLTRAEKLGLDPADVLANTWTQRDFTDADDIGAVMSSRIENHLERIIDDGTLEPLPELGAATGRYEWAIDRTAQAHPDVPDHWRAELVDRGSYIDGRMTQRGIELTLEQPEWTNQLGPVPENIDDRLEWMQLAAEVDLFRSKYNVPGDDPVAIPERLRNHDLGRNLADRVTQLHKSTAIREAKGTHRTVDPAEQIAAARKIGHRVDARRPVADAEKAAAALTPDRQSPLEKLLARAQSQAAAAKAGLESTKAKSQEIDTAAVDHAPDVAPTVTQRGPKL